MAHKRMHEQAIECWQRTQALAFCRISAPTTAKQVPSKLNNKEGLPMIAQATDNTPPEAFLERTLDPMASCKVASDSTTNPVLRQAPLHDTCKPL
jgi:hypothetical protein